MIIVILYKARASLLTHFVDIHPYLVSCPLQLVFQFQHSFLYIPLVAYHNMLTTYRETLQENILKVSYSSLWLLHLELQLMTFIMLINDLRAYVIKKKYLQYSTWLLQDSPVSLYAMYRVQVAWIVYVKYNPTCFTILRNFLPHIAMRVYGILSTLTYHLRCYVCLTS